MPRFAFLLALAFTAALHAADAKRVNVLFFAVDDLRTEMGCYGNTIIKTPNLDKLAASGTVFNRAYCQQAVCSPSRSSLLTGARPDTTRVWDLQTHFRKNIPDVVTLPQHFKAAGYHTEAMGKIYHGGLDDPDSWSVPSWTQAGNAAGGQGQKGKKQGGKKSAFVEPGDEIFAAPGDDGCVDQSKIEQLEKQAKERQAKRRESDRGPAFAAPDVQDNELFDGKLADHAVDRLREVSKADKPFFLAVGFLKPHLPFIAPKRYWDLYDPAQIPPAPNPFPPQGVTKFSLANSGELRSYDGMPKQGPVPADQARQLKHGYYAAASFTDAQIGKVLDELDRLGLRENTVVVLWGDHGWKLGEHGEWCKHTNFENDAHAPLLLRAPGFPAGQKTDALVEFVDIYPSLCELAGLPRPAHLEGSSFVPVLKDAKRPWKSAAFSQYPRQSVMGYSMRTDRYRLTRWVNKQNHEDVQAVELYDEQTDPQENVNLAADPAHAELVKQLTAQAVAGWKPVQIK
jgi:arylsulfatase A-like enzyme